MASHGERSDSARGARGAFGAYIVTIANGDKRCGLRTSLSLVLAISHCVSVLKSDSPTSSTVIVKREKDRERGCRPTDLVLLSRVWWEIGHGGDGQESSS